MPIHFGELCMFSSLCGRLFFTNVYLHFLPFVLSFSRIYLFIDTFLYLFFIFVLFFELVSDEKFE